MINISFISVIYNHPQSTIIKMINSLLECLQYCEYNYEIILINNGETKIDDLKVRYSDFNLVIYDTANLGYCGGNNYGILKSKGEYIFIINPDVIIKNSLCIDWMYSASKIYKAISGKIIGSPKWYTYPSSFPTDKKYNSITLPFYMNEPTLSKPGNWKMFPYIDGCLMCFSRLLFDDIGGFDEEFHPGYFGENAFCFSAFLHNFILYDANIDSYYDHIQDHSNYVSCNILEWTKNGRAYFYEKYALPNWNKFLEYLR